MFFVDSETGKAQIKDLETCASDGIPVSFFGFIVCQENGETLIQSDRESFHFIRATEGVKASALRDGAAALRAVEGHHTVAVVPEWTPNFSRRLLGISGYCDNMRAACARHPER